MAPLELPTTAGDYDALVMLGEVLRLGRSHIQLALECITVTHNLLDEDSSYSELCDDLVIVGHQLDRVLETTKEVRRSLLAHRSEGK